MAGPRIKPGGVAFYSDELGGVTEVHSSKCQHCGKHTEFPSRRKMFEHIDVCRVCMKTICLECAGKPCLPEVKRIEEAERAHQRKLQMRRNLGF